MLYYNQVIKLNTFSGGIVCAYRHSSHSNPFPPQSTFSARFVKGTNAKRSFYYEKMNIRKTMIAVLATAMCATGAVIPTSAVTASECPPHSIVHNHGNYVDYGTDSTYCYRTGYVQCSEYCTKCSYSTMYNHTLSSRTHTEELYYEAYEVHIRCSYCGYMIS